MVKRSIVYLSFSLAIIVGIMISACSQNNLRDSESQEGLQVVTSISILADIAENIAGSRAEVEYIVPVGDNPEDYELISSDLQKISNADIFILNGWGLEEVIERSLTNVSDTPIIYATQGGNPIPLIAGNQPDPHAWFDVQFIINYYVKNILTAFIELDPAGEEDYRLNSNSYIAELHDLDTWIKDQVSQIPDENRVIVISENALKYYGEVYDFQTEGIWELNSHEEGTPQQISRIVDLVSSADIPAIFVETTIDNRYMTTISNETGVPIAGEIYTDALGLPGSGAETYINIMNHNTNQFVNGLSQ